MEFTYVGGGHFRDKSVPKGEIAATLHGNEIVKHFAELLAAALKPVIASVRPVIEEAALRRAAADCEHFAKQFRPTGDCQAVLRLQEGRILALIPAKGAALITPQPETPK